MDNNIAELSRRYREEMLRMYGSKQPAVQQTAAEVSESVPKDGEMMPEPAGLPAPAEPSVSALPEPIIEESFDDPELPEHFQTQLPEDWTAQEAYEKYNSAVGKLRVVAATARSAYPVAGARVMVYTHIGGRSYLNYVLTTDISGETPTVELPAPPAALSQNPENADPYSICDIDIFATGYFHSEAKNVHIFAGVTTRQVFQLIPLPLHFTAAEEAAFPASDTGEVER